MPRQLVKGFQLSARRPRRGNSIVTYSSIARAGRGSTKRIDDGQPVVDKLPMLHVLSVEGIAFRL